jgi:hypothetical protein
MLKSIVFGLVRDSNELFVRIVSPVETPAFEDPLSS